MEIKILKLNPLEWSKMAKNCYLGSFGEIRDPEYDRIDYALIGFNKETDKPLGYITCKEFDADTTYWQFGGALQGTVGIPAWRVYQAAVEWEEGQHKRIFTMIENTNNRMIKMAMSIGYKIIGTRTISNSIMLELLLNFEGGD